jgi:TATA-binding protein-associated factor Taf7
MTESSDRKELEKRLEQARRIADLALDPLTKERLQRLAQELEEQLRLSK